MFPAKQVQELRCNRLYGMGVVMENYHFLLHSGASVFCITVVPWSRICGGECPVYSKILNNYFKARVLQLHPHRQ